MNNLIVGKTIENVRLNKDIKLKLFETTVKIALFLSQQAMKNKTITFEDYVQLCTQLLFRSVLYRVYTQKN